MAKLDVSTGSVRSTFLQKVKQILSETVSSTSSQDICPDQYVGRISAFIGNEGFEIRRQVKCRPEGLSCLILVLESPHQEEFKKPYGPAKGKTGDNIVKHLGAVNGLEKYKGFGLILLNAVRYQCSRGQSTNKHRDKTFVGIWNVGGKKNFSTRLKNIYRPDDVVVVSCTKGNLRGGRKNQLRTFVHDAVKKTLQKRNAVILRRTHPSSWYAENNRNSEWPVAELNNGV